MGVARSTQALQKSLLRTRSYAKPAFFVVQAAVERASAAEVIASNETLLQAAEEISKE